MIRADQFAVTSGAVSRLLMPLRSDMRVTVYTSGTARLYVSTTPLTVINTDLSAGTLTPANLALVECRRRPGSDGSAASGKTEGKRLSRSYFPSTSSAQGLLKKAALLSSQSLPPEQVPDLPQLESW